MPSYADGTAAIVREFEASGSDTDRECLHYVLHERAAPTLRIGGDGGFGRNGRARRGAAGAASAWGTAHGLWRAECERDDTRRTAMRAAAPTLKWQSGLSRH